jgi:protein involved in sex pheromone biosynthesis
LKKKLTVFLIAVGLLTMTACQTPWSGQKEQKIVKNAPKGSEKVTVIPQADDKEYRTIHADSPSGTRGYIQYGVDNRVDIDEMEMGLMRLSKEPYNPDTYYFQSGHYISPKEIDSMIARKSKAYPDGLNPPLGKGKDLGQQAADQPKVLSYILEQDYLKSAGKDSYKLGGISLAISVNSVYTDSLYNKKDGKTYTADVTLDTKKVMNDGKSYANKILDRVRKVKGLGNVPIFISLYIESAPGSYVPGHFYAKTLVDAGRYNIDKWDAVNEQYVMFPSSAATKIARGDSEAFSKFKDDVEKYFPNSIGVIGKGFYRDKELTDLTININIRFFDKTEVVSFANYVAALLQSQFPFSQRLPVQVYINSIDQPEAIIVKTPSMDTPFVHVYKMYK